MASPKILVIRTYFHPAATPGSRRLGAFCRHLAEDGFDVTLVALRPPGRPGATELARQQREPYRSILLEHTLRPGSLAAGLEHRLRKWFPGFLGDGYAQARDRVHREAAALLSRERFDCLLTTFPFTSSLQVASRLHDRFGIPWIADLRDLPDEFDSARKRWSTRRSVARVAGYCRTAVRLVTVSAPLRSALETRYGLAVPVEVIHNGYDEDAFPADGGGSGTSANFDIVFCGGARRGDGRTAQLLREGLEVLQRRGVDLAGVRIVLAGPNDAESLGLGRADQHAVPVIRRGIVPHAEALAAMQSAALLVSLASAGAKGILTSKIFEYARAGRPVLGIPRDDDALDGFIHRARIGQACGTSEEVADFLASWLATWRRTGELPVAEPDREYLAGFSRRAQSRKLGEVIRSCV